MDAFNLDIWKQQWETFLSAPYIIASFIFGAGLVGWWLRGIQSAGTIGGLNGRITVCEDRLKFAAEQIVAAEKAKGEAESQFHIYKAEVSANAGNVALAATAAKFNAAIEKWSAANNAVSSAIGAVSGVSARGSAGTVTVQIDEDS